MSAILQSADEISSSAKELSGMQSHHPGLLITIINFNHVASDQPLAELLDRTSSNICEASEVISLCAHHQQRILDDVR